MKHRHVVPELMDDPQIPRADHERALAGLARLNRWSRGDAGLWKVLRQEAQAISPQQLRVLDIATGSGDLPIKLACRANRVKLNMSISACDISETALTMARSKAQSAGVDIHFFQLDVTNNLIPNEYDAIICSLFLHHLSDANAIELIRKMSSYTQRLIVINDLCRSRVNLMLVKTASHLLSRSPIVHFDGPASVRAAFTISEAQALAEQAGLKDAEVHTHFPCRWLLTWRKPT